jgi:DNA ligase (NAD+)
MGDDIFDMLDAVSSNRVVELEGLVQQARHAYYNTGSSVVTDDIYDAWVDELSSLKHDSPAVFQVGAAPVSEWSKVPHSIPMGSLSKINTLEELTAWVMSAGSSKTASLLVTEKLDGMSIAVEYIDGVFSRAITRGDGLQGEDISVNVAKMQGVLGRLPKAFTGVLRGEIILTKSAHAKHFPQYSNPRNAAVGIAKRYDGQGCEYLTILFYQVADGLDFDNEDAQFVWLTKSGLKVPNWYVTAMVPGIRTPHDLWLEYQQFKRAELDYEIDGLVVRINDLAAQMALGDVDSRPKGAVAFKFAPMTRESILRRIDWQVGASGRITPVAVFDPVRVLGTEITNASLYNVAYINTLGIDVGAKILIARAQDVIPRVVAVRVATGTVAAPPLECPRCDGATQMEGEYLVCTNTADCPAQAAGRVRRYVTTLDVKEWGETLIEKLIEMALVQDVGDLYALSVEQLSEVDRMGPKSAAKAHKTLRAKKQVPLETLLGALSIPLCGPSTIKLAMDAGLDTLEALKTATLDQLVAVEGLGPARARSLHGWFEKHSGIVAKLLAHGVAIEARQQGVLSGKTVCFTGASAKPRTELERLVKLAGGGIKASVGKKLTYLVLSDPQSTSSKAQAARKNGTTCVSEQELLRIIGAT